MEKTYSPQSIETRWYQFWEENGYFNTDKHPDDSRDDKERDNFCVMLPPPNVTGRLHMGHAFQDTIMDAMTRYYRMKGDNALWQAGTDHAGIATQMVVERLINDEGKTRHDYGREKFIDRIWQWKEESGNTITQQLRRMGASLDWSRERFTLDEGLSTAVIEVFVRLHDEGLIYRGKRLVNWDPVLHTAVSVFELDEDSGNRYIKFEDGYRYVGVPGSFDYKITEYKTYAILLEAPDTVLAVAKRLESISTSILWFSDVASHKAELQWRVSSVLSCMLLSLLAVLLSQLPIGEKRYVLIVISMLIYFIYSNFLGVSKSLLKHDEIPSIIGLWWVHALLIIALLVLYYLPQVKRRLKQNSGLQVLKASQ